MKDGSFRLVEYKKDEVRPEEEKNSFWYCAAGAVTVSSIVLVFVLVMWDLLERSIYG